MRKNSEAKRHGLRSGVPCMEHKCVECCVETRMPLSRLDINRILKMGYQLEDFAIKTEEGWRLKNSSGRCFFLSEGGCKIYPYRPEGCRLYPLVYDEDLKKAALDHLCPYCYEFEVREGDIKKLKMLLERLERETKMQLCRNL